MKRSPFFVSTYFLYLRMATRNHKPVYNYRIIFEKTDGHLDNGQGYAITEEDAVLMFTKVRSKLDKKRLKKSTLYFENRLIKKL